MSLWLVCEWSRKYQAIWFPTPLTPQSQELKTNPDKKTVEKQHTKDLKCLIDTWLIDPTFTKFRWLIQTHIVRSSPDKHYTNINCSCEFVVRLWMVTKVPHCLVSNAFDPPITRTLSLRGTEGVFNGLDTCMHVLTIYDPPLEPSNRFQRRKTNPEKKIVKTTHKGLEMSD